MSSPPEPTARTPREAADDRGSSEDEHTSRPVAAVIIPVYNGAETLGALLRGLLGAAVGDRLAIAVVCNGCDDDSASVARSFSGVQVVELGHASKTDALNLGDELAGDVFPRFYVDADVALDASALGKLIDAASTSDPVAVAPASTFDTDGKPWLVRAHFYGLTHLPRRALWRSSHVSGKGMYGTNRTGRARFGTFPPLRADDAYFDAQFAPEERRVVATAGARISVPSSTGSLLRSQSRVKHANRDLERRESMRIGGPRASGTSLGARLRRTASLWRTSPLVEEFDLRRSIPLVLGFYVVQVVVFVRVRAAALTGRDVSWR